MKIRNSRLEGLVGADLFWLTNTAPHAIYFYSDILVKACNRLSAIRQGQHLRCIDEGQKSSNCRISGYRNR